MEVEDQIWSARDRAVIAKTEQYLEESYSMKVEVEELESLEKNADYAAAKSSLPMSEKQWQADLGEQRDGWSLL